MVITSRKNDAVKRFREVLRDKSLRDAENIFAVEGDHLCGELAAAGYTIISAAVTERAQEKYPAAAKALAANAQELAVISEDIAEYISDTKSPQGLFAVAQKPHIPDSFSGAHRLVLLDGVQDPGNVGTMIRTAEALGFDGAILSQECADIWSPKSLRASMGSILRLPCISRELTQTIAGLREQGFAVYGAMLDETAVRLGEVSFPEKAAAVIGSEGRGISKETAAACDRGLYIPITGAESLNAAAAAAMIMWELSKRNAD